MRPAISGLLLLFLLTGGPARAGSVLRLPMPERFGSIDARTFDNQGHRDGSARLTMARTGAGDVTLQVAIRLDNGTRTQLRARMRPVPGVRRLRLVREQARTVRADGSLVVSLVIDHQRGVAVCKSGSQPARTLRLPVDDRVANVPLNLVLRPLITGQRRRIRYQTVACGKELRLVDTAATVVGRIAAADGRKSLVEVRCRFEIGPLLSLLAAPFLPKLEFWFHADRSAAWVAHRTPLYSGGPTVLLVRQPLDPSDLQPRNRQASNIK